MTTAATPARSLAFGAVDDGVWGAAWLPSAGPSAPVALGAEGGVGVVDASLESDGIDDPWLLAAATADLTVAAAGPAWRHEGSGGFDQLCRVEGRLTAAGRERKVSCWGWRAVADAAPGRERLASFRQVAAWFDAGDGLAVLARRPRSARGQEGDLITAAVLDGERPVAVSDPRLSTTYGADGRPRRAGLELWIGSEEEEYPRRAAGEAIGEPAAWRVEGLDLQAQLFRWHSGGKDGTGIYLLGQVR